jgi:antitoxin component YwqK of YwqJK toxin-antitoxin module
MPYLNTIEMTGNYKIHPFLWDKNFKIILVFALTLFLSCRNSGIKIVSRYENGMVEVADELPNIHDTLNYTFKKYYPDGKIRKIASVVNGKFSGKVMTYSVTGKIHEIDSLLEPCGVDTGTCDAILVRYYENGKISQRYVVKDGKLNGLAQQYNNRGILVKQYYLIDDSIKNGEYEEFYENGNVACKATYSMGKPVGTEYFFKENGDTGKYYQNYPWGKGYPAKEFHDDGTSLQVDYFGPKRTAALWKWFDKNGKLVRQKLAYPVNGVYIKPQ